MQDIFLYMMCKKNTDIKIRIHIIYNIFLLNKMIKKIDNFDWNLLLKILFVSKHWGKMFLFLFWDNQMAQRLASLDNAVNIVNMGTSSFFQDDKLNCTKICFTYLLNMTEKHTNKVFKYLILVFYIYNV